MDKGPVSDPRLGATGTQPPSLVNKTCQLQKPGATLVMACGPHGGTGAKDEQWLVKGQRSKDRPASRRDGSARRSHLLQVQENIHQGGVREWASEMVHG